MTQSSSPFQTIAVLGSGTMGAGIAQVSAQCGYSVWLYDLNDQLLEASVGRIYQTLERGKAKGKITDETFALTIQNLKTNLKTTTQLTDLKNAELFIEAIPEHLELKQNLFVELEAIALNPNAIFASNTSSISITGIGGKTTCQERVAGLHFFNPVALMKLVEVIRGTRTDQTTVDRLTNFVKTLNKTPVIAKDTPGFIVNRVARPFYGEALKMLGENLASVSEIDSAMRDIGGFRMGPFELMDLIGIDVNFAVTQSVYNAFFQEARYRPHPIQQKMVEAGLLGQKTGEGFYHYTPEKTPKPDTTTPSPIRLSQQAISERIIAMIINEATSALMEGVATPQDIDTAMKLGTNYPNGPLAWGDEIGLDNVLRTLTELHTRYQEERYRPTVLLQGLLQGSASLCR